MGMDTIDWSIVAEIAHAIGHAEGKHEYFAKDLPDAHDVLLREVVELQEAIEAEDLANVQEEAAQIGAVAYRILKLVKGLKQ
jgi:hypothetical protein